MPPGLRLVSLLPLLVLLYLPTPAFAQRQPGSILWGAEIEGQVYGLPNPPGDMRAVAAFESQAGAHASILTFGNGWQTGSHWNAFPVDSMQAIRDHGSIPFYTWTSKGADNRQFSSAIISSGRYDAYLHAWAHAAAVWGHPFFLRFDHEANGNWYPWGEGHNPDGSTPNNNAPGSFSAMWRHVYRVFEAEHADNVTWVWSVNYECACPGKYAPLAQVYPGSPYVDWTAVDAYNYYASAWSTPEQLYLGGGPLHLVNVYDLLLAVAPDKPLMISETASVERASDPAAKARWLTHAFGPLLSELPAVKAVLYFNETDRNVTAPIGSSSSSLAAFKTALDAPMFVTSSFAALGPGKIGPP